MGRLDGKIAVITGATSGIGWKTAEVFVAEGAQIVIAGRRAAEGEALASQLRGNCVFRQTDVTVEDQMKSLIALAVDKFGGIDCLFNNAGGPAQTGGIEGIEVERFSKATPWPTTGPTVFFVGRHEPRKGLAVLLEAMARLPADVRLWVAGDGPETCMLQQQTSADTRVEWLGRIDDDELARRLRGADVFCAPSLYGESFGVVLLEAMAAQTPIVASDLPGYRNVARRGQDALLVEPGDARALAEALGRLLEQPTLSETLVASGEARAAEFSMDRLAERYLDFYDSLAA